MVSPFHIPTSGPPARTAAAGPVHAFLIGRVWGSRHGGSLYAQALLEALTRKGWRVSLVAERFATEPKTAECACLTAFFQRSLLNAPRRARDIFTLCRWILRAPRALVIVQGDLPRLFYTLLQIRVPLIFIRQDAILTCPGNDRFLPRTRSVCRRPLGLACLAVDHAEACLGQSSWVRRIGRLAFRLRDRLLLAFIHNFVANSSYIAHAHGRAGLVLYPPRLSAGPAPVRSARDLRRLVFCGRLEPVKGPADAIRIVSLLPERFRLDLLGDGPERGRLEELVEELQLRPRVNFFGWVDHATRDSTLASAGVLLMPSLWDEAFGMAGIEALAQGTPVVAYDVGGVSEWCRDDAGVLVPCGDLRQAAAAVRQLTDDPARWAAYSQSARRLSELEFPPTRFPSELDQVLEEVQRRWD